MAHKPTGESYCVIAAHLVSGLHLSHEASLISLCGAWEGEDLCGNSQIASVEVDR